LQEADELSALDLSFVHGRGRPGTGGSGGAPTAGAGAAAAGANGAPLHPCVATATLGLSRARSVVALVVGGDRVVGREDGRPLSGAVPVVVVGDDAFEPFASADDADGGGSPPDLPAWEAAGEELDDGIIGEGEVRRRNVRADPDAADPRAEAPPAGGAAGPGDAAGASGGGPHRTDDGSFVLDVIFYPPELGGRGVGLSDDDSGDDDDDDDDDAAGGPDDPAPCRRARRWRGAALGVEGVRAVGLWCGGGPGSGGTVAAVLPRVGEPPSLEILRAAPRRGGGEVGGGGGGCGGPTWG